MPQEIENRIVKLLKDNRVDFILNPLTPGLTFEPDFMINLENELTFINILQISQNEDVDWLTLRLIEQIFEIKTTYGSKSVFTLIIIDYDFLKPYCKELINNFYDLVITDINNIHRLSDIYTKPKEDNFRLWTLEKDYINQRFESFKPLRISNYFYKAISGKDIDAHISRLVKGLGYSITRKFPVHNLKNYYLSRDMNLNLYYDFYINNKIIEVKSFKKINKKILQNLLAMSRLIRYRKVNNRIESVDQSMVLVLNGNIEGPDYDRHRYFRMLYTSGWNVYSYSELNINLLKSILNYGTY